MKYGHIKNSILRRTSMSCDQAPINTRYERRKAERAAKKNTITDRELGAFLTNALNKAIQEDQKTQN